MMVSNLISRPHLEKNNLLRSGADSEGFGRVSEEPLLIQNLIFPRKFLKI